MQRSESVDMEREREKERKVGEIKKKIVVNEIPNEWNAIAYNECH